MFKFKVNKYKHRARVLAAEVIKYRNRAKNAELENAKLQATMKLHSGDCCSLNNEVNMFRERWQDAEAETRRIESKFEMAKALYKELEMSHVIDAAKVTSLKDLDKEGLYSTYTSGDEAVEIEAARKEFMKAFRRAYTKTVDKIEHKVFIKPSLWKRFKRKIRKMIGKGQYYEIRFNQRH